VVAIARAEFGVFSFGTSGAARASALGQARPMTQAASLSLGLAPPTSTTAAWMQRTMRRVES
jgi:hypothetical protein